MPVAAVPWIAAGIGSLFAGLLSFVAKHLTLRLSRVVAAVAIFGALSAAFFFAVNGLLAGIRVGLPPNVSLYAGLILPSNLDECLSVMASVKTLRWAYDWNIRIIDSKLSI